MKLFTLSLCTITAALALVAPLPSRRTGNEVTAKASTLIRRFEADILADDKLWKDKTCKGDFLVDIMRSSDAEAGPKIPATKNRNPPSAKSDWQGDLRHELDTWGWHDTGNSQSYAALNQHFKVQSIIDGLGVNGQPKIDGGKNIYYAVEHADPKMTDKNGWRVPVKDQRYKVDGKEYRMTEAKHEFIMNPSDGVILGLDLDGPTNAARRQWGREPNSDELPKLKALSDILWGYWTRENGNVKNIHYFWMMGVVNRDTQAILARALKNVKKELVSWPGVTFGMDTDEGRALLGSANGAVFGWFLAQHKEQLGDKRISKVTAAFSDLNGKPAATWEAPHLIFYVEDVPAN